MEVVYEGRFLRLVREGHWEYAQRPHSSEAVIIVAVTPEDRLILVEQYRIPVHAYVIEFPAGIIGDDPLRRDEPIDEAARRELLEETGYSAGRITRLFSGTCSAGLTDEYATFCLAADLCRVAPGGGVDGERIRLHEIPLGEIDAWIAAREGLGVKIDARLFTGIYLLERWLGTHQGGG
jgi:ADP-ribose pyrophosphatase